MMVNQIWCEETSARLMNQSLREIGFHPPWHIRDIISYEINNYDKPAIKIISKYMAKKLFNKKKIGLKLIQNRMVQKNSIYIKNISQVWVKPRSRISFPPPPLIRKVKK